MKTLDLHETTVQGTVRYLLKHGYAEEWGSELTDKGTLTPVIAPTGKQLE